MDILQLPRRFDEPLHSYLKHLGTTKYFPLALSYNKLCFQTHEELDKFCAELKASGHHLSDQDHNLLKTFDRVFWIRYVRALKG